MGKTHTQSGDNPVLSRALSAHAERSISDEQVRRVTDPVIKMIREGKFEAPPQPDRVGIPWRRMSAMAAAFALAITVVLMQGLLGGGALVEIDDPPVPLAAYWMVPGSSLTLICESSRREIEAVVRTVNGAYSLRELIAAEDSYLLADIPDGKFSIKSHGEHVGTLKISGGIAQLSLN